MRRSKKSNMGIKIILPIICVIIVVVTFVLLFDMKKKAGNNEANNSVKIENVVENTNTNIEENIIEENTVVNETETNTVVDDVENENTVQSEVISNADDHLSADKQSKAVKLVSEHWGEDNSVYYTNESVASNNEYIVAVRDKSTTEVKQYFKVNIETGKVKVEY